MIEYRWLIAAAPALALAVPVSGQQQQPGVMILAQAQDRCMTTFAVRLSKESQDDEAIFNQAKANCSGLAAKLDEAIGRELPTDKAVELRTMLAEQEKPNFMGMLSKIRSDRAARSAP